MFICGDCKNISTPLEKPVKVIVEIRDKVYNNKKRMGKKMIFKESKGFETVKERSVCQNCAIRVTSNEIN